MAVIIVTHAVEISSGSKLFEVNLLGQYNCIHTNASLGWCLKQMISPLQAQL